MLGLRNTLMAVFLAVMHLSGNAQTDVSRADLAASIPIADVHMHLYRGLQPTELQTIMDRNRVYWGGGVGPVGPGYDPQDFKQLLGERYFPAGAQAEQYEIHDKGGENALQDKDSPTFKALALKLEGQFQRKEISGIGELILNNHRSSFMPSFRRKVPIDGEAFQVLYELANKYQGYVQIHMDDDRDSIRELKSVAQKYPDVPFILSHCMTRSSAKLAREVLEQHPNLYCETSYRSTARNDFPGFRPYVIHDAESVREEWLELIEAMPDRFMVGSDIYTKDVSYDRVISAIRTGLLANLSEQALRKLAHENAVRIFKLPPAPSMPVQ